MYRIVHLLGDAPMSPESPCPGRPYARFPSTRASRSSTDRSRSITSSTFRRSSSSSSHKEAAGGGVARIGTGRSGISGRSTGPGGAGISAWPMGSSPPRHGGRRAGLVRVGFTTGARERDVPALKRLLAVQRAHGVAAKILTVDELQSLEPGIDATDLAVGGYDEHAGYADPVATSLGLARAPEGPGAEVREGAEGLE